LEAVVVEVVVEVDGWVSKTRFGLPERVTKKLLISMLILPLK
jgi:hypothetical protein